MSFGGLFKCSWIAKREMFHVSADGTTSPSSKSLDLLTARCLCAW